MRSTLKQRDLICGTILMAIAWCILLAFEAAKWMLNGIIRIFIK